MQARPFEHFLKQFPALTRRQRERLLSLLVPAAKRDQGVDLIEQTAAQRLACPDCHTRHLYRHGRAHGRLRGWLLPFRVVASRYLTNYLGWRWALDGGRIGSAEGLLRAALGIGRPATLHT